MRSIFVLAIVAVAAAGHSVVVSAQANLFGAGYGDAPDPGGGGGGVLAPGMAVGGSSILTFSATGTVKFSTGSPTAGPDGSAASTNVNSYRSIAGLRADRRQMLCGVFLDDGVPGSAPARIDFRDSGIGTAFASLAPLLGQSFFIGDGMTGEGTGTVQQFTAPVGATRLFLGFLDAFAFSGDPGWYDDNVGELEVTVTLVPEPGSCIAMAFGAAWLLRRRQTTVR